MWLPGPHLPAQLRRGSHLAGCGGREDQKEDPAVLKGQPGLGSGPRGWGFGQAGGPVCMDGVAAVLVFCERVLGTNGGT